MENESAEHLLLSALIVVEEGGEESNVLMQRWLSALLTRWFNPKTTPDYASLYRLVQMRLNIHREFHRASTEELQGLAFTLYNAHTVYFLHEKREDIVLIDKEKVLAIIEEAKKSAGVHRATEVHACDEARRAAEAEAVAVVTALSKGFQKNHANAGGAEAVAAEEFLTATPETLFLTAGALAAASEATAALALLQRWLTRVTLITDQYPRSKEKIDIIMLMQMRIERYRSEFNAEAVLNLILLLHQTHIAIAQPLINIEKASMSQTIAAAARTWAKEEAAAAAAAEAAAEG